MNKQLRIIIVLSLVFFPIFSYSQDFITVNSEGVGDIIIEKAESRARDVAIEDALRRAVEKAIGTFINSETIVKNSVLISDSIYTQARGYIKEYTILNEVSDGNLYRVSIESHVSKIKIQDDLEALGLLIARKHKPRIMVIIPEYHIHRTIHDPACETEIIKKLLEKGFKVVDQSQVSKIRYNEQIKAGIEGDAKLAAKIGLEYGAEIIIIGEAFSESAGRVVSGFTTCRARVEARAIRTDTAEILVADGKHATDLDIAEVIAGKKACQKAGSELATYFIDQILSKWSSDVTNLTSVNMIINGLNYEQFIKFKHVLIQNIRGIKAIHQRSFTNGRAVVEIDLKGNTQFLSQELILKKINGFNVDVTDFSANRLSINVSVK
ncbi:hypothetical protein JCM12298_01060 [Desulfothermus naphthae]